MKAEREAVGNHQNVEVWSGDEAVRGQGPG